MGTFRPSIEFNPQQQSPLELLGKAAQLKSMQQGQQLQGLQIQEQQLSLKSQQAMQKAYMEAPGDPNKAAMLAAQYGALPKDVIGLKSQLLKQQADQLDLFAKKGAVATQDANLMQGAHDAVDAAPPELKQQVYQQQLAGLAQRLSDPSQLQQMPPQYPGDQAFKVIGVAVKAHSEQMNDLAKQAETAKNTAQASEANAATAKTTAETEAYKGLGLVPGASPETQGLMNYLKTVPGASPAKYEAWQAAQKAKATLGTDIQKTYAEANARQQAAQGSPEDAGKLLANGDVTLADLKSRGTTPKFITQAIGFAQKFKPDYNPADEVIAESVAKSPAANQFFGSANSLIAKGGTLDQLKELGAKIPQHDMPVLNTVDDWQKLARGKGPLAGYAALALGVADDYGKVMGGGQASDHARDAALSLFSQAASPEERQQAIDATRQAVQSQRDHRIGKNQFMKRAYEVDTGSGAADPFAQFGGKAR